MEINWNIFVFYCKADLFCDILQTDFVENDDSEKSIDIFPYIQRATLDMILETAMGIQPNMQVEKRSDYGNSIQTINHIFQQRQVLPWYQVFGR